MNEHKSRPAEPAEAGIADQARQFLDALFGQKAETEHVLIWTLSDKRSAWFSDIDGAAAFVRANSARDVYVGVSASPQAHGADQRLKIEGGERLPSSLSALFADIDIAGPGHQKKNLPPDEAGAMSILFPEIPPSIIIHTGGGIQAWWLFKEPWALASEEGVQKATALSKRWIRALRARAAARGWDVDQVGDLTRVLRVPGSTNNKTGQPRPVVLRKIDATREYDPSSLEEYLDLIGAPRVDAPAARGIIIGQLVYDPNADFSHAKFDLLCVAEPKFKLSWEHKRSVRELPDQSPSAYDQALANVAAQAGWGDQEICNLLISHRRKYAADLKLRDSYYVSTIRKARELAGETQVWNNIDEIIALHDARRKTGTPEAVKENDVHVQDALATLDHISEVVGIKITKIYKYPGQEPTYRLKSEAGEMGEIDMGGVRSLMDQRVFSERVAALTNHRMPTLKVAEWDKLSRLLFDALTVEELGPEATTDGMVRAWLDQYFEGLEIQDSIENADQSKGPFRSRQFESLCFFKPSFQRWIATNHGLDRIKNHELLAIFKRLCIEAGAENIHPDRGGRTTRSVYRMPSNYRPPRTLLKNSKSL